MHVLKKASGVTRGQNSEMLENRPKLFEGELWARMLAGAPDQGAAVTVACARTLLGSPRGARW